MKLEVDRMISRPKYLSKIIPFIDTELIKVISGVRRSGKSFLLEAIRNHILAQNPEHHIIEINFEKLEFEPLLDYHALNNYLTDKIDAASPKKNYIFLDEIQEVTGFEKVINSLRVTYREQVDIFVTGSNAKLLSSELSTLIAGRYVEFDVYPFTFDEYLSAKKLHYPDISNTEAFMTYINDGGMPFIVAQNLLPEQRDNYLSDVYNSIILKDVIERNQIRDADLLKRVYRFAIGNVGRVFSSLSVVKFLKNEHVNTSVATVNNYIDAGVDAYFYIPVRKFNMEGKKLLKTQEKIYTVDHGLRQAILGRNEQDIELILENIVLLELKSRGYQVTVGSSNALEIDFIAEKVVNHQMEKLYIQVSYLLASAETAKREFASLEAISDSFPKYVLTLDPLLRGNDKGVRHLNLVDWLLDLEN